LDTDGICGVVDGFSERRRLGGAGQAAGVFKAESDLFAKAKTPNNAARGRAFLFPAAYIQATGNRTFVTIRLPGAKSGHEMIVFINGKASGSLPVAGIPYVIDSQGRLYIAEEEGFPRVVRYLVQ